MTIERKIAYQSRVNKSFKNCTIDNIDTIANDLYTYFNKSEEARDYITLKYIKTKEELMNIKNDTYTIQSEYKEKQSKNQLTNEESICERLSCLSY